MRHCNSVTLSRLPPPAILRPSDSDSVTNRRHDADHYTQQEPSQLALAVPNANFAYSYRNLYKLHNAYLFNIDGGDLSWQLCTA